MTITKKSGTKITPSTVPEMVPPSTPDPMALRPPDPAPVPSTSGRTPSENAIEVMMMGRNLCRAAVITASVARSPLSYRSRANSTIRMAFLPVRPMTVSSPTWKNTPFSNPPSQAPLSAPTMPIGMASITAKGIDQLS